MKYLGITLTKYLQDLHEETTNSDKWNQMNQINGKIFQVHRQDDLISRFQFFSIWSKKSIKIQANYFMNFDKLILKFIWRRRRLGSEGEQNWITDATQL